MPVDIENGSAVSPSRPGERRDFLRAETSADHRSLDGTIGSLDSPEAYRRYLLGVQAFRQSIETSLASFDLNHRFGAWRPSMLAGLMAADLRALGLTPLNAAPMPDLSYDVADLFGTLYVLEGSVMGAQVLYRQVRAIGFDATNGARHLSAQAGSLRNWKEFTEILEKAPTFDLDRAASAARATFRAAEASMKRATR